MLLPSGSQYEKPSMLAIPNLLRVSQDIPKLWLYAQYLFSSGAFRHLVKRLHSHPLCRRPQSSAARSDRIAFFEKVVLIAYSQHSKR